MNAERATTDAAVLRLSAKASRLARAGRLWFFADEIAAGAVAPPRLARVHDDGGRDLGLGFTGAAKIALRLCGPWPGSAVPDRESFFADRLTTALRARREFGPGGGVRLVHGESDGLPGLVVDRYVAVLVMQVTSAYVERSLDAIVPFLVGETAAESVVARNDFAARRHERLPEEVLLLHGRRIVEVAIVEHGVRHLVRPFAGHKTGFYLDQRPARGVVRELARGRTVLDLFGYQGAFALAALHGGATSALCVEQSAAALALANVGAEQNGLAGLSTQQASVFDFLRTARDQAMRYGLIVLDPPALAKSRREVARAQRDYRVLNRAALCLLEPGGYLLTCSCSHQMTLPDFEEVVRQAAVGLPFRVVLRQRLGAGMDHPCLITHAESEYLKVLLLQRCENTLAAP